MSMSYSLLQEPDTSTLIHLPISIQLNGNLGRMWDRVVYAMVDVCTRNEPAVTSMGLPLATSS